MSQIPIITEEQANKFAKKFATLAQKLCAATMIVAAIFLLFTPIVDVYESGKHSLSVSLVSIDSAASQSISLMDSTQVKNLPKEISQIGEFINYGIVTICLLVVNLSVISLAISISKKSKKSGLFTDVYKKQNPSIPLCIAALLLGIVWGASIFLCSKIENLYLDGASKEFLKLFEIEITTKMFFPFILGALSCLLSFCATPEKLKFNIMKKTYNQQTVSTAVDTEKGRVEVLASYKKLLDDGVITKEEFENKKEELLNQK